MIQLGIMLGLLAGVCLMMQKWAALPIYIASLILLGVGTTNFAWQDAVLLFAFVLFMALSGLALSFRDWMEIRKWDEQSRVQVLEEVCIRG